MYYPYNDHSSAFDILSTNSTGTTLTVVNYFIGANKCTKFTTSILTVNKNRLKFAISGLSTENRFNVGIKRR